MGRASGVRGSFLFSVPVKDTGVGGELGTGLRGSPLRMLSSMRLAGWTGTAGVLAVWAATAMGQSCTTQAKMTAAQRTEIGAAAYGLGTAVLAGDTARVQANTVAQFAGDFGTTGYLIRSAAERLAGDSLAVTQVYLLDAVGRKAGDTSEADFACALTGGVSEADFAIPGLPPGRFAFAMVEAKGANPYLLAFLLQQEGGVNGSWKMAGFYPHEREAAGHDGVWYWTTARADAKADKPWLAWVLYSEADQLLRPAGFVSSGNLDRLRGEQRSAAPEPLVNGLSAGTPLSVEGPTGTEFRVTNLGAQTSDKGTALDLVVHFQADGAMTGDAATQRNVAVATALLTAHPELRQGFKDVFVMADTAGGSPFVVERPITSIAVVTK